LMLIQCANDSQCTSPQELARDVGPFDTLRLGPNDVLAYSTRGPMSQIRVLTQPVIGPAVAPKPQVPAACIEGLGGMCGVPSLVARNGHAVLCARDRSDLLCIESDASGVQYAPLDGVISRPH
jgi:hypothetical protein